MRCPGCQRENRPDAKFCDRCGTALQEPFESVSLASSYADVRRSLIESLEQQKATAEILRVISQSPTDTQPVFDVIKRRSTVRWLFFRRVRL